MTKVKVYEIENREMVQTRTDWEKELKTLGKGEALVIPLNKLPSVRKRLRHIEGLEYSKNAKKNEAYVNFVETDKEPKPKK